MPSPRTTGATATSRIENFIPRSVIVPYVQISAKRKTQQRSYHHYCRSERQCQNSNHHCDRNHKQPDHFIESFVIDVATYQIIRDDSIIQPLATTVSEEGSDPLRYLLSSSRSKSPFNSITQRVLDARGVGSPLPSSNHSQTCSNSKSVCNIADAEKLPLQVPVRLRMLRCNLPPLPISS